MADPLLKNKFPERSLNQAVGVAAMCLQEEPSVRPLIGDVVAAITSLEVAPPDEPIPESLSPSKHTSQEVLSYPPTRQSQTISRRMATVIFSRAMKRNR